MLVMKKAIARYAVARVRALAWPRRYAPAMARKSAAARLAPPTRAPSTLATDSSSPAFDGFTEPP
jgi:hypothetical protein